ARPVNAAVSQGTGFAGEWLWSDPLLGVMSLTPDSFHGGSAAGGAVAEPATDVGNTEDPTQGLRGQLYVSAIGDGSVERVNPAGVVNPFVTTGLSGPIEMP